MSGQAAPSQVEPFASGTWAQLKATVGEPTVVVFTTTTCTMCPAVFQQLGRQIAGGRLKAKLVGVVMDRAPGEDDAALLADAHYRETARLFAFDGPEAALRHGVDPRWRAVTPYVVYLAPGQTPQVRIGPPSDADLQQWQRR